MDLNTKLSVLIHSSCLLSSIVAWGKHSNLHELKYHARPLILYMIFLSTNCNCVACRFPLTPVNFPSRSGLGLQKSSPKGDAAFWWKYFVVLVWLYSCNPAQEFPVLSPMQKYQTINWVFHRNNHWLRFIPTAMLSIIAGVPAILPRRLQFVTFISVWYTDAAIARTTKASYLRVRWNAFAKLQSERSN